MIPIIIGTIASSGAGGAYFTYNLYTTCSEVTPITLYSDSAALIVGTTLYYDSALTSPYDQNVVAGSGTVYRFSGSIGQITSIYLCYTAYTAYTDCTQESDFSPSILYVELGEYFVVGRMISTDAEGITPVASVELVIEGYAISTDESGIITSTNICGT